MSVETTLDGASAIRTQRQAEEANTAVQASTFSSILEGQSVVVRKNSAGAEVVQPRLNLVEGSNITITLADDTVNSEADITFALPASPDVASLKVAGEQVVGTRGAAVAAVAGTAAAVYDAATQTLINDLKAAVNDLRDRIRATGGHGLIDD